MGFLSKFEGRMEDGLEGPSSKISPVQIAKKAEKAMRREKMVGAGKQYAPTLYTVLVNPEDDRRLFGYYPTLAGETETYLSAKAAEEGLLMDGQPLVRFIVDEGLRHGKFDIVAELVSAPIISQLRHEEMVRYGLEDAAPAAPAYAPQRVAQPQQAAYAAQPQQPAPVAPRQAQPQAAPAPAAGARPIQSSVATGTPGVVPGVAAVPDPLPERPAIREQLPYVPEDEIDRSIDYGEYTFNSQDFEDYDENGPSMNFAPSNVADDVHSKRISQPIEQAYEDSNLSPQAAAADFSGFDVRADGVNSADLPPRTAAPTQVFAAGAAGANPVPTVGAVRARLVDTTTNRSYDLATGRAIIGRSSASDIVLDDINASRQHAEIKLEPQGVWSIADLGSTNGTNVNGHRITGQVLREGDVISIGMTKLVFTAN